MKPLQNRLNLVLDRIVAEDFLKNNGLGNEVGFWIFDYPAQHEMIVRDYISHLDEKLNKRGYTFATINVFEIIVEMLESRDIFDRACAREKQVGVDELRKTMSGPLSQEKVARFIAEKIKPETLEFVLMTGMGSAWPLVRGHELLSALQDVMGNTPLVLFYPGQYSGSDLHPFNIIESKNYYRGFKLVPESGK